MKLPLLCLYAFCLLAAAADAAPVHVALKSTANALPNADGFLTLGSVAGLSGGDKAARLRVAAVLVARAPLSGETRSLTRGDLALKLRQAGINPDTQVVLEGADQADVTADADPPAPTTVQTGRGVRGDNVPSAALFPNPTPPLLGAGGPLVHPGDAVTILIQSGPLTITASGIARDKGGAGDMIRVHRDGVMTDLTVQVLDSQDVRLEI